MSQELSHNAGEMVAGLTQPGKVIQGQEGANHLHSCWCQFKNWTENILVIIITLTFIAVSHDVLALTNIDQSAVTYSLKI